MLCLIIGTGRCGTKSLTKLIDQQENWQAWHEPKPRLPWAVDLGLLRSKMQYWQRFENFAEAGFYFLPYVEEVLHQLEEARCICLKRPMQATVQSYLCKTNERPGEPPRNHWTPHEGNLWRLDPRWDKHYPNYFLHATDRQTYIRRYYEDYYTEAQSFATMESRFKLMAMDDALNTKAGQTEIFEFLGIAQPDYDVGITLNEGGQDG